MPSNNLMTITTFDDAGNMTGVQNPVTQVLNRPIIPQYTTAARPAYASVFKGFVYFDTTTNKLVVAGAAAYETVTSV